MCGIIGFAANPGSKGGWKNKRDGLKSFIEQGLYTDAVRGEDATGIMAVHKDNVFKPATYYKRALEAADFVRLPIAQSLMEFPDDMRIWVGHNRYSTVDRTRGADKNAHPFQVGHITLVHNGTFSDYMQWAEHPEKIYVDSARAAAEIAGSGEEVALPKFKGGYACVWHNSKTGTFNVFRNERKPLFYTALSSDTEDWNGLVFGSEPDMLHWLIRRNGLPYSNVWKEFKANHWYCSKADTPTEFTIKEIEPVKEVPVHAPFLVVTETGGKTTGTNNSSGQAVQSVPSISERAVRKIAAKLGHVGFTYRQVAKCRKVGFLLYKNQRDRGEGSFTCNSRSVVIHNISKAMYDELPEVADLIITGVKAGILTAEIPLPEAKEVQKSGTLSCDHCGGFVNPSASGTIFSRNLTICHICAENDDLLSTLGVRA